MELAHRLTAQEVIAYFECSTKAVLLSQSVVGERPDIAAALSNKHAIASRSVFERVTEGTLIDYSKVSRAAPPHHHSLHLIDCRTTHLDWRRFEALLTNAEIEIRTSQIAPVLFSPFSRIERWYTSVLLFSAFAIYDAIGRVPAVGYICYGQEPVVKKFRLGRSEERLKILRQFVRARQSHKPVTPELNAHCPVCQYKNQCRQKAIDNDSLSLISSIGIKERRKLLESNITTITQLSYTYRPRRKRRVHATPRPATSLVINRNDSRLRALAIRKKQVHILNNEPVPIEGTPVYFDVEGIPGSDAYYLVGMRFKREDEWIECSYWAHSRAQEQNVWEQFVHTLLTIDNPQLVHYGSYESRYLVHMKRRYPEAIAAHDQFDIIINKSHNLLKSIYATVYFPTYTNGLKEVAGYLGFQWSDPNVTGMLASLLRLEWELEPQEAIRQLLIRYNIEDCRATQVVSDALRSYHWQLQEGVTSTPGLVDVDALKVPYHTTYGPFVGAIPDFQKINSAAYWNYQRDRVFVRRSGRLPLRRKSRKVGGRSKLPPRPDKIAYFELNRPRQCPRCGGREIWKTRCHERTVIDIVFSKRGSRRLITKQIIQRYKCTACLKEMGIPRQKTRIGSGLRAYIIYLLIAMRLSNLQISHHLDDVFGIVISDTTVHWVKSTTAMELEPLYNRILKSIASGSLVHVDETTGVVFGGGHYVWVFANWDTVAYVYSAGRDARILKEILAEFHGVLISDFYGAYDSVECTQQRCLIHLMRDINEAMTKAPFNNELTDMGSAFGTLLRSIVDTIDRRGLKRRFLGKYKKEADKFMLVIGKSRYVSEAAQALQKRFVKNGDRLFTFLEHDDVPWNNNNAEHAVRAFTRVRNSMSTSTAKGTKEYAILLSIQQTLKYRDIDFLKFLLTPDKHIDGLG